MDNKSKNPDYRLQPGGGYCFHGWSGKPQTSQHSIPSPPEGKDEFSEWKDWMKDYLKEKNEEEKVPSATPETKKHEDIAWNTHVQQAREVQKQRAHNLANAVVSSRQARTAKMFQQRFERSERFALVSEPGDKRPLPPPLPSNNIEETTKENKINGSAPQTPVIENIVKEEKENREEKATDDVIDGMTQLHPALPDHLSFLNITPGTDALLVSPQPWKFKTDPVPPPPPHKNFNRSPKGFVGSYVTSYY